MAGSGAGGRIAITPDVMRGVSIGVGGCGAAIGHSVSAIRAPHGLSDGDVGSAWGEFRRVWSTALATVADDARICARKISAAADFWVTLDRAAVFGAGVQSAR